MAGTSLTELEQQTLLGFMLKEEEVCLTELPPGLAGEEKDAFIARVKKLVAGVDARVGATALDTEDVEKLKKELVAKHTK